MKVAICNQREKPGEIYLYILLRVSYPPILARYLPFLVIMALEERLPRRPRNSYRLASVRLVIRCFWNRIIVAVAIRLVLILYALVEFVLTKCRTE